MQSPYTLGLAQIEEIANAIEDLNISKAETLGAENWRSIALTDTFESQAHFALASAFNEVCLLSCQSFMSLTLRFVRQDLFTADRRSSLDRGRVSITILQENHRLARHQSTSRSS